MNNVKRLNETTVEIDGDTYELKRKAFTLRPSEGDEIHVIHVNGDIQISKWDDESFHEAMWNQGNVSVDSEAAELEHDARIKERELLDFIAELNHREVWEPDWSDYDREKICFSSYHYKSKEFVAISTYVYQTRPSTHYFKPELESEIREKFGHDDLRLIYCRER